MTVSTTASRAAYTGNGSSTFFAYPNKVISSSDIAVYIDGVLQSTGFVVGPPTDSGVIVGFTLAPTLGQNIVLVSNPSQLQSTALPSTGPFPAKSVETGLDKLTLLVQRMSDLVTRSFRLSDGDSTTASTVLPSPSPNAIIGWDPTGHMLQNVDPTTLATIVAFGTANADVFTGTGAQTIFTLTANPGAQANLDVAVGGVTQTPGIDYVWSGSTTVTFSSAPPNGVKILLRYFRGLPQGITDSAATTFTQLGTGAVPQNVQARDRVVVRARDHGAVLDGVADDLAAIQRSLNYIALMQSYQTVVGAVTGGYVSIAYELDFDSSKCLISDALVCPAYFKAKGQNATIIQSNPAKNIFDGGSSAYQWEIDGINFVGGKNHLYLENANVDVTRWRIRNCTFSVSSDYAIKTFPSGGATSHLSANLTISKCAFYKTKKGILNYCDSAMIEDSWVFVSKDNFTANTAFIVNGSLTTDGYPILHLNNFFGVPAMGTQGVDRLATVRWIDHNAGAIYVRSSRFGGEFAGMPVVYTFAPAKTVTPYIGPAISIECSEVYVGPSAATDSAVVVLNGVVPQRLSISNNNGPADAPYIINYGGQIASFPTYFSNYETASGQKAYNKFALQILNNLSQGPDGVIYTARVPLGLRPYINNFRQTKVRRTTNQTITNGVVNNFISFDTVDYDTQGGFAIANPTRLVVPMGATKMRLQCWFSLNGGFTAGSLIVRILTSGGAIIASESIATNTNADNTAYTIATDIDGTPGDYYQVSVLCNTAGNLTMIASTVTTTALDYIG